jgi:hypothetical protein
MSDTSSESDLSIDLDFEEAIMQIEILQQSYEETETRLSWIKDNVSIQIDGWDLNDILDELHISALKEIEETGQTSFSSHVLALF